MQPQHPQAGQSAKQLQVVVLRLSTAASCDLTQPRACCLSKV